MDALRQDLRYALRMLGKAPALTGAAVLSLALGLGANVTVFTWTTGTLLRPFRGVPEQDRLFELTPQRGTDAYLSLSYPEFLDLSRDVRRSRLLAQEDVALNLDGDGTPERIWALLVSATSFDVLGVRAQLGRTLVADDDALPRGRAVAVISHRLWQRRFGGDPSVIGRTVRLNARPFTVVGVAPRGFEGARLGLAYDAFVPVTTAEELGLGGGRLADRGRLWLEALGRLRPGVSMAQARSEIEALSRRLAEAHPDTNRNVTLRVDALPDSPWGGARLLKPVLLVLCAVVAVVLLVACANVANLLLARATARRREISVRLALGAGRARVVRQLLTESVLLGALGGAGGLAAAWWASGLLTGFFPAHDFPIAFDFALDGRVMAFAAVLSLAAGIALGLAPALQSTDRALVGTLGDEATAVVGGGRRQRLRHALVVAQVALSAVLLVSAGLLVRSARNARALDTGFRSHGMLLGSLDLLGSAYTPPRGLVFYRRLLERARALPGVESVTLARRVPLGFGGTSADGIEVEGYDAPADAPHFTFFNEVGPRYLATMGIPVVAGRDLADADDEQAERVAVVNETMARWYWPGRHAVGGRVRLRGEWYTVVGVARDIKQLGLGQRPLPMMFRPVLQAYVPDVTVHARTRGDVLALAAPLAALVRELDPTLPLFAIQTLDEHVTAATVQQRLAQALLLGFAALALLLAGVGLYGLLAYAVGQRTREIGLRMALGGRPADIARLVLGQGLGLVGLGLLLGSAGALAASRGLAALLVGVSPSDPLTFAIVLAVLSATGLAACALPARRATRIDPAVALRCQ